MSDGASDDLSGNVARLHPPGIAHHPALDRSVQGLIGVQLRNMYEHFVQQPIPERLLDIVHRLAEGDPADPPSTSSGSTP